MPYVLSTAWVKPGKTDDLKAWYRELEERRDEAFQTLDRQHAAVMDDCTVEGSAGRVYAQLQYAFQNPRKEEARA